MKKLEFLNAEETARVQKVSSFADQVKTVIDMLASKGGSASEALQTFIETTNSQLYLRLTVYDPMMQKHSEILQTRFGSGMELSPLLQKPSLERLTNLRLVEGLTDIQQRQHDFTQLEASRGLRNVLRRLPLEKLFQPLSKVSFPPRISVTVGVAGVGKTTLVKLFLYRWTNGEMDEGFQFVLPVTFRELNTYDKLSAERLIRTAFPHITEPGYLSSGEARTLLILDGLDEFRYHLDFSNAIVCTDPKRELQADALITNIIRGNLLPDFSIWVTSRHIAAGQIPGGLVDRMTEIPVFGDIEIKDFLVQMFFENRDISKQVWSHIKANRALHILCAVPTFCLIVGSSIGFLLKNSTERPSEMTAVPKTMSEAYFHYFMMAVGNSNWQEKERETFRIEQAAPNSRKLITNLGRLAFYGLIKKKYVFYEQDLKANGIDLPSLQGSLCSRVLLKEEAHLSTVYFFAHLTLQEFLAATYYHVAAKRAIFDLFTESGMSWPKLGFLNHFKNAIQRSLQADEGHLDIFVRFLCGLLSPQASKILSGWLVAKDEHSSCRSQVIDFLESCLSADCKITSATINIMHCLNELQHTEISRSVQEAMRSESLAGRLTPMNCSALAYLLQVSDMCLEETNLTNCLTYDVVRSLLAPLLYCCNLRLDNNHFKDDVMDLLASVLTAKDCHIEKISLAENEIGNKGAKALARSLMVNRSIAVLNLHSNAIGSKGAAALADMLKINLTLRSLSLQNNIIKEEGAKFIAEALLTNRKLTTLHLQKNAVGPKGASRIAEALKKNSSLQELLLSDNCVGDVGAAGLAEALKVNLSLITLDLQSNSISNVGVTALTEALKQNKALLHLNLRENSIGVKGAVEIASALSQNDTLRDLDLAANLLHDEGAKAIALAVKVNETLESLHLQWNFIQTKAAKSLALALQHNQTLTSLDLQENAIGDEGMAALCVALKVNTTLTALYLQGASIGVSGAKALAEALMRNRSLSTLDLRGNSIGVVGAKALANALKVNTGLRTLNLQENALGMDGAICIATALTGNHSLAHINLKGNRIGQSGAKMITDAIQTNSPNCVVEI
ncbi:NLR family CARD domain-containing protein 3 [Ambystoma mexicanum]|uniref:NLR family CARD domain-containing protein 3 n=1 Tax=Ambystoma mexicanum TaxID=8296 RepID=UPI0037E78A41